MIANSYPLLVRIGKHSNQLTHSIERSRRSSSLLVRSCPLLSLVHQLPINCLPTVLQHHPRYLLSSVDASTKQYWLAVNDKHNVRLIDSQSNDLVHLQDLFAHGIPALIDPNVCILNDLSGHTGDVECLAWSPSVDYLLASGSQDKTIRVCCPSLAADSSSFRSRLRSYGTWRRHRR